MENETDNLVIDDSAFEVVRAEAAALAAKEVVARGTNYDSATSIALKVIKDLSKHPHIAQSLALLHPDHFVQANLTNLTKYTHATIRATTLAASESATNTKAKVSAEVTASAQQVKERMLRLTKYYFADHKKLGREIADIVMGSGHIDRARDLERLADIVTEHQATLSSDTVNYRSTDVADARKYALAIRQSVEDTVPGTWADNNRRAFTLLDRAYDEVCDAVEFVFRNSPEVLALFPPLRAGTRTRGSTWKPTEVEKGPEDPQPE